MRTLSNNYGKPLIVVLFLFGSIRAFGQNEEFAKYGIEETGHIPKGLKVGQKAPIIKAYDLNGNLVNMEVELKNKQLVLIFYRGVWCPVCIRYLKNLQDSLNYIENLGAKVIAITPEVDEKAKSTESKTGATFRIISDSSEKWMKEYDVWFEVTGYYQTKVNVGRLGDIASNNGKDKAILPVPATYVIDKNGIIKYVQFDYNYKKRATVLDIMNVIKNDQ